LPADSITFAAPNAGLPIGASSPATDATVGDLANRIAELEARWKSRDDADKNAAAAAAKKFAARPFGLIQVDTGAFNQDADNVAVVGEARNGVDIRRAWLGCEGEGFDIFFYRFNVDFTTFDASTQTRPVIFDAFLDVRLLPLVGNVRVGHFREPFSLERLTSSIDIPLLERSASINTLAPFRNIGIMAFDCNERETMTWAYGLFAEDTNEFGEDYRDRAGVAATGRVTWLPWYDEPAAGRYLLHLGSSGSYRRLGDERRRFASFPEAIFKEGATRTPNFVDTGVLPLADYYLQGVEFTTVLGSLSLQGEYAWLYGDLTTGRSVFFHGGYLEASYWLTGENRNYNRRLGIYGPVTPYSNFFRVRTDGGIATGPGAWELTARASTFDLNNGPAAGGRLDNVTLGLAWNYAVRCRVMFNYIHAFLDRGGRDSNADIVATRFQVAF
jgi:phosphate-selective porin OprO/OprP